MAGRKRFSKRRPNFKKKGNKKYGKSSVLTVPKGVDGISDRLRTTVVYSQLVDISGTGAVGTNVFAGNSLFDPDTTGVGSQPAYHSQLGALYKRYRVFGSKMMLRAATTGGTSGAQNAILAVTPGTDASDFANIEAMIANPYTKWRMHNISDRGGPIVNYKSTSRVVGIQPASVGSSDVFTGLTGGTLVGSSPEREWFWHIGVQAADGSSTNTLHCVVDITYYCEYYEREPQSLS